MAKKKYYGEKSIFPDMNKKTPVSQIPCGGDRKYKDDMEYIDSVIKKNIPPKKKKD